MLEIKTKLSTAYHLQTDGQIGQINLKLEQYLQMLINYRQKTWPEAIIEFTYNNKIKYNNKDDIF